MFVDEQSFDASELKRMALALTLSNMGADGLGDESRCADEAWARLLAGIMECGHDEDEADTLIDGEMRSWLHDLEVAQPYALKRGAELLERFAWA